MLDDLNCALNEVLAILKRDPEYVEALAVEVTFCLGPSLISVQPLATGEAVEKEAALIEAHVRSKN